MRIFITKPIIESGIEILRSAGHEVNVHQGEKGITKEELYSAAKESDALITMLSDKIDEEFLEKNSHLLVIANYAVGFNNIDIEAAKRLAIPVANTPDVLTHATAELAFALLLSSARRITEAHNSIASNNWKGWEPMGFLGQNLAKKTLGIFGAGRIGQSFAKMCQGAFDMDVLYTSRTEKNDFPAKRVSFDELVEKSDIISVHCDLNATTMGKFNREIFKKMKSSSIFINTARGEIHNEVDLHWALTHGEVWGAGLDVTNPEPMSADSPLLKLPNVTITPHIGSATLRARSEMSDLVATNILKGLLKEKLLTPVY